MTDINLNSGERLKFIREIFNEGAKLSASQFAYIMGESRDKIANYESGRTAIPIELLHELYYRGYNPNFVITGEETPFADNQAGDMIKLTLTKRLKLKELQNEKLVSYLEAIPHKEIATIQKVAAGLIKNVGK